MILKTNLGKNSYTYGGVSITAGVCLMVVILGSYVGFPRPYESLAKPYSIYIQKTNINNVYVDLGSWLRPKEMLRKQSFFFFPFHNHSNIRMSLPLLFSSI